MKILIKSGGRILPAFFLLVMMSCHSGYVSLDYHIYHEACYNQDSTLAAFMATKKAYLKPKGISRLPDGGQSKVIYNRTDLYVLDIENNNFRNVWHLDDLTLMKDYILSSLDIKMILSDSLLAFQITPVTDLDFYLKYARTTADSLQIEKAGDRYSQPLKLDFTQEKVQQIDSSEFIAMLDYDNSISLTEINNIVKNIPLSELGLSIMEIHPKTEEDYINETIYLENDSPISRRAVVEQIITKLSKEEIRELLFRMDNHLNKLEDYEKAKYSLYSKETYEQIRALL